VVARSRIAPVRTVTAAVVVTALFAAMTPGTASAAERPENEVWQSVGLTNATAIGPDGPARTGWTEQWIGRCDPALIAGTVIEDSCDEPSTQRIVLTMPGMDILEELEPDDVSYALLLLDRPYGWVDDVDCVPNVVEAHDLSTVANAATWQSAPRWNESTRQDAVARVASGCEGSPWASRLSTDVTDAVVDAVADGRSTMTFGLKAGDESCMECGWNTVGSNAKLQVWFNRPPATPDLQVGPEYGSPQQCTGEAVHLRTSAKVRATVDDPDLDQNGWPAGSMTATFELVRPEDPDTVLWSLTTTPRAVASTHTATIPSHLFTGGGEHVIRVHATDPAGLDGPRAECRVVVDIEAPEAPAVRPLLGYDAYYRPDVARGGIGVVGGFEVFSPSDDVASYVWSSRNESLTTMGTRVAAGKGPVVFAAAPQYRGSSQIYVAAIDRAGNVSDATEYRFAVSWDANGTPAPITVTGPSSIARGAPATYSVRLSDDAPEPYGTVTVKRGSTVVATGEFDARTLSFTIPAIKVAPGANQLVFSYRATPQARTWSTTRTLTVAKRDAVVLASTGSTWLQGSPHVVTVAVGTSDATPSGTVAVYRGSTRLGWATLAGGRAAVRIPGGALPTGTQALSVRYSGSSGVAPAVRPISVTVR
jgi:hypothetical protein